MNHTPPPFRRGPKDFKTMNEERDEGEEGEERAQTEESAVNESEESRRQKPAQRSSIRGLEFSPYPDLLYCGDLQSGRLRPWMTEYFSSKHIVQSSVRKTSKSCMTAQTKESSSPN